MPPMGVRMNVGSRGQLTQAQKRKMRNERREEKLVPKKIPENLLTLLTQLQYTEIRDIFLFFDCDGSGRLEDGEMREALKMLGVAETEEKIDDLIRAIDENGDGEVDWHEFLLFAAALLSDPNADHNQLQMIMAFEAFAAHCAIDGTPSYDAVLDCRLVRKLMTTCGMMPLQPKEIDAFMATIDPQGVGQVRMDDVMSLPLWESTPEALLAMDASQRFELPEQPPSPLRVPEPLPLHELQKRRQQRVVNTMTASAGKQDVYKMPDFPSGTRGARIEPAGMSSDGLVALPPSCSAAGAPTRLPINSRERLEPYTMPPQQLPIPAQQTTSQERALPPGVLNVRAPQPSSDLRPRMAASATYGVTQAKEALRPQPQYDPPPVTAIASHYADPLIPYEVRRAPPSRQLPAEAPATPTTAGSSAYQYGPSRGNFSQPPASAGQMASSMLVPQQRPVPTSGALVEWRGSGAPNGALQSSVGAPQGGLQMGALDIGPVDVMSAPAREIMAHAAYEIAQTKLGVVQELASATMGVAEARFNVVHAHVGDPSLSSTWQGGMWDSLSSLLRPSRLMGPSLAPIQQSQQLPPQNQLRQYL